MSIIKEEEENFNQKGNKKNIIKILIWISIVIFITILYIILNIINSKQILYIDNPSNNEILVTISTLAPIAIPAKSYNEIKIKNQTYTLSVDWEYLWEFTIKKSDENFFLNPTKSHYILEEAIYTDKEINNEAEEIKINVNGIDFYWPFSILDSIYINSKWDYWLDEDLPNNISVPEDKDYLTFKKIYRFDDFIEMYNNWYLHYQYE